MGNVKLPHLTDEQLARFQDGELSARESRHLQACPSCTTRLRDIEAAAAAYTEYRDTIRGPSLTPIPRPWSPLSTLVARHEAEHPPRTFRWWPALAVAAGAAALVFAVVFHQTIEPNGRRATELLSQSARTTFSLSRRVSMRVHGRTLFRPAVLITDSALDADPDQKHLRGLFEEARYSWSDPLSARSFQAWRMELREKRDSVTVAHDRPDEVSYRVRTETTDGVLHSASLTLRGPDLRPTDAAFDFVGEEPLEMQETTAAPAEAPREKPQAPSTAAVTETPATPEDMLRVFVALDAIGADAGDPIDVSEDSNHRHIVVRSTGLSHERQEQIERALTPLPRVRADFNTVGSAPVHSPPAPSERLSNGIPTALREQFENRSGGVVAFQELTDRVLDASATIVARAHTLEVLSEKFAPDVEMSLSVRDREVLAQLRQRHFSEIERLATRIRSEMKPLLATDFREENQPGRDGLWNSARDLDNSLNRLLAGSYTQSAGQEMLRKLPSQMEQLEAAIRMQQGKK